MGQLKILVEGTTTELECYTINQKYNATRFVRPFPTTRTIKTFCNNSQWRACMDRNGQSLCTAEELKTNDYNINAKAKTGDIIYGKLFLCHF